MAATHNKLADYLLLGTSWLVLLLFIGIMLLPDGTLPLLEAHPQYPPMTQASARMAQQPLGWGTVLAFALIALMGIFILVGNRKRGKWGKIAVWLIVSFGVYAFFWGIMIRDYTAYQAGDHSFWGGFPLPTAWMIYDLWLWPLVMVAIYFLFFKRWTWTQNDQARFDELLDDNKPPQNG